MNSVNARLSPTTATSTSAKYLSKISVILALFLTVGTFPSRRVAVNSSKTARTLRVMDADEAGGVVRGRPSKSGLLGYCALARPQRASQPHVNPAMEGLNSPTDSRHRKSLPRPSDAAQNRLIRARPHRGRASRKPLRRHAGSPLANRKGTTCAFGEPRTAQDLNCGRHRVDGSE